MRLKKMKNRKNLGKILSCIIVLVFLLVACKPDDVLKPSDLVSSTSESSSNDNSSKSSQSQDEDKDITSGENEPLSSSGSQSSRPGSKTESKDKSSGGVASKESDGVSSDKTSGQGSKESLAGGEKLKVSLEYPKFDSIVLTDKIEFSWTSNINEAEFSLIIEEKSGSDYKLKHRIDNIKGNRHTFQKRLESNKEYYWRLEALYKGENHKIGSYGSSPGTRFMTVNNPKQHPANLGKNFSFNGSITEDVLKNYLSRAMTLSFMSMPSYYDQSEIRMILNTGVKYVSRASIPWQAEIEYDRSINTFKNQIDYLHSFDPDIIVEVCIFETVHRSADVVPIPDWVFQAFGKKPENRNFSYDAMIFTDGKYLNQWGDNLSVPDITREETQMYFYYRACRYIDAGFEGIHWGQVHLMGRHDQKKKFRSWEKLLVMVREYAYKNARRKMVLHNAHTHGIYGPSNKLLFDFHSFPMRNRAPAGEVERPATKNNPQPTELAVGHLDSIFKKSKGGLTHSGWSCDSLPYFVEIDNYGGIKDSDPKNINQPWHDSWPWGFDEISWFVNQPEAYRGRWLAEINDWIRSTDDAGFLCMPGSRGYYKLDVNAMSKYHVTSSRAGVLVSEDEKAIRSVWLARK